jgi:hypothetical protein
LFAAGLRAVSPRIVHGFSTRTALAQGSASTVVAQALGLERPPLTVRQVHGAQVVRVVGEAAEGEGDALLATPSEGGVAVAVWSADCVPVLLADLRGRAVAAIHSGWRGTVAGVVPATLERLRRELGVEPADLAAAIGPCIEWPAFEVGPEVAALFPDLHVHREGFARPHVDLVGAVRAQLERAGVASERIERVGGCTFSHAAAYASYRREGRGCGQQLSAIGFARRA